MRPLLRGSRLRDHQARQSVRRRRGHQLRRSLLQGFQTDSKSAFGGIIAFNREVTGECAELVSRQFAECIIAPSFSKEAVEIFAAKKNLRLLTVALGKAHNDFDFKRVGGGLLVQTPDNQICAEGALRCVTKRQPTSSQIAD